MESGCWILMELNMNLNLLYKKGEGNPRLFVVMKISH